MQTATTIARSTRVKGKAAMEIIRPIGYNDLESLIHLAESAGNGLTSLPKNPAILEKKISDSIQSFSKIFSKEHEELFLFVMEECETEKIVGICGIVSRVGVEEPFFSLKLETEFKASASIGINRELQILTPQIIRNGPSEICTLFLLPEYRKGSLGRLLSFSRFLFIGAFPDRFEESVIAEMRGVVDKEGHSPFWEHVGKHFYNMDFLTADLLSSENKSFITEMMPSHPLYVNCLPKEAQDVIGRAHPNTIPALKLLEHEGFHWDNEVDIFDAGPKIAVKKEEIRTIKESTVTKVAGTFDEDFEDTLYLLANEKIDFRASYSPIKINDHGEILIPSKVARNMGLEIGSSVRYALTHKD
jgi:arginine N-succinyltransferase